MKLVLHIEFGNDAMKTYNDAAKSLEQTAKKLRDYARVTAGEGGRIMDKNGNSVGRWDIVSTDPGKS